MDTVLVAAGAALLFVVAYRTYGRWLSRTVFRLDDAAVTPAEECRDGRDFVPTPTPVVFGHHFTSIAGTGPIVGPAIAVFWGWLPALVWVVLGSIFVGAVHDFGALVVSLRNRGQTVGEVAGRLISPRVRLLFLGVLFLALTVVLGIFGLVISKVFAQYPGSVLPVWAAMPLAVAVGLWVRRGGGVWGPSLLSLAVLIAAVWAGTYYLPVRLETLLGVETGGPGVNAIVIWTGLLLAYCAVASVLPVGVLLQPRDFVNSLLLAGTLAALVLGIAAAGLGGAASLADSAPAFVPAESRPAGAPPVWPFLFITIACGACSGFHCLVSSGTSSKQLRRETDATAVGYGAMLLEGFLAVLVILACTAGLGMGVVHTGGAAAADGLTGRAAWATVYETGGTWEAFGLGQKVGAFVDGAANFLTALGVPAAFGVTLIATLVASFAATTLDSATRLQRYVVQELAATVQVPALANRYAATAVAVVTGGALAMIPASAVAGPGSGGLLLWPLFGATNQLLAGLAFLVVAFYLRRRGRPVWFLLGPTVLMLVMPAWAMLEQLFDPGVGWLRTDRWLLGGFGLVVVALQAWMTVEALLLWPRVRGVIETPLPPLKATRPDRAPA